MIILGLTGGIGMGKSTVARMLRLMGYPVYSADKAVHNLLKRGGAAVIPVAKIFPQALQKGAIRREIVGEIVFSQPAKLKKLEGILHPLVRKAEKSFLTQARLKKKPIAVLEIPLLFETGADKRCDVVFCVSAKKAVQKSRVMMRLGMTKTKLKAILKRQLTDKERKARADYVITTSLSYEDTKKQVQTIIRNLLRK